MLLAPGVNRHPPRAYSSARSPYPVQRMFSLRMLCYLNAAALTRTRCPRDPIMTRTHLIATLAALLVAGGTTAAFAAPNAMADGDFDLRKSPKNSAKAVNFVEEGDLLTITECTKSWCYAKVPGPDGWIRRDYLLPIDDEGEVYEDEPFSLNFNFGPGGPKITIGGGSSGGGGNGGGGGGAPRACFFEDVGYAGQSFCVGAGQSVPNVGYQWNDAISSVRVYGGAQVEACADDNFNGGCTTWAQNVSNVGGNWNDRVTSLTVY